jgi:hypothetical protein
MWSTRDSLGSWGMSNSMGTAWTMNVQTEDHGDEIETFQDGSTTVASMEEEEETMASSKKPSVSSPQRRQQQQRSAVEETSSSCDLVDGTWVCHPYKIELLERQLFSNNPGVARRTAIIETLRSRTYCVTFI